MINKDITNEEALELLEKEKAYMLGHGGDMQSIALDKAIKALEQDACEDAVSRASVFEIMGNLMSIPYDFDRTITEKDVSESMDEIRALPPATPVACIATVKFSKEDMQELVNEKMKDIVVERKKGKWINGDPICPCCGEDKFKDLDADLWSDWKPKYCPNCGSFMRE